MARSKQLVQIEPPALLGRRARINAFKQFVETNRLKMKHDQLVARYCVDTGISQPTIRGYLKLFYEAGVYVKPSLIFTDSLILTPEEYAHVQSEYERQKEEKEN